MLRFVGLYMNSECNKMTYSRIISVKHLEYFKRSKLETIFQRSGLTIFNINATICYHHKQTVLRRLPSKQKTCFDLFIFRGFNMLEDFPINIVSEFDLNHLKPM